MPRHLVPHKSGVHRIAAIALYRALLTQCRALHLPSPQANEIQNLIRNRFKEQRHVTSHRLLKVSFTAGYEAIDHLDNAVAGDEASMAYLVELLARAPADAKQPPQRLATQKELDAQRRERAKAEKAVRDRTPTISLWDRPLPLEKLSGKRHVPVLVNANHIPMLRLRKPQPQRLSAYINDKIVQRQKRHDRRIRLEAEMDWAVGEDRWDSIVNRVCGVDSRGEEPGWRDEVGMSLREVKSALQREKEKNGVMARRMQGVVDRERVAFDEEKREERKVRRRERVVQKSEDRKGEEHKHETADAVVQADLG